MARARSRGKVRVSSYSRGGKRAGRVHSYTRSKKPTRRSDFQSYLIKRVRV